MKLLVLLCMFCFFSCKQISESPREKQNINREWKFNLGDIEDSSKLTEINYSSWSDISLPHSFSIPYFLGSDVYQGYGWYSKEIIIPQSWMEKTINLEFEGAFIESEVFINGKEVGTHVGGYTGFTFDITGYLKPGKNQIAVRVNNLWKPDVAPRAGDHQFSGGIYRDVYLNITDKLHIDWQGIFIQTPIVTKKSASITADIEIKNDYFEDQDFTIKTKIIAPNGETVSKHENSYLAKANQVTEVHLNLGVIRNPNLWSPESPTLYKMINSIYMGDTEVDRYDENFGIRKFEWTADKGFFLNDEPYYLRGANVHQDQAGWGDAVTNAAIRRDVELIKNAGFNCIRGSHYPHDPAFSKACDELGIIFFQENAFWGMGGSAGDRGWGTPPSSCYPGNPKDQNAFNKSVLAQLKEMIKIHKNYASIAAWSMSNEPFFTDSSTDDAMRSLLNQATDSARLWDPTREVAIGGAQRKDVDRLGKNAIAFYNGDGASRDEFQNPNVPNLVSEYGSTTTHRPGKFEPGWGDILSAPQGSNDPANPPAWRSGHIIWCGFDHGTVGGEGLATMGIIDYQRIPKRAYYWYKEAYKNKHPNPQEPQWAQEGIPAKVRLETNKSTIKGTDGTDDVQLLVTILDKDGKHISNNVPVTLKIVEGPGEFPTGRTITFMPPSDDEASDITIRDGLAAIAMRSYHGGKTKIEAKSEGLNGSRITINTIGEPQWIEGETKPTPNRPYRRYSSHKANTVDELEMLLAGNRPSWVSSTQSGTNKAFANDGNSQTSWIPSLNDTKKWWKLGLEASYVVDKIQIEFPTKDIYHFTIETSTDNHTWKKVVENKDHQMEKVRLYKGDFGKNVAFIRISFQSPKAGLAEVKVGGKNR